VLWSGPLRRREAGPSGCSSLRTGASSPTSIRNFCQSGAYFPKSCQSPARYPIGAAPQRPAKDAARDATLKRCSSSGCHCSRARPAFACAKCRPAAALVLLPASSTLTRCTSPIEFVNSGAVPPVLVIWSRPRYAHGMPY
jgi:hypothetical protein